MNTTKRILAAAVAVLLLSTASTHAIVGLGIDRDGTNVVISWPSQGSEHYLIQYRQTLDPTNTWANLTNNYPANSTNRTTFTLYGVVLPPSSGGGDRTREDRD